MTYAIRLLDSIEQKGRPLPLTFAAAHSVVLKTLLASTDGLACDDRGLLDSNAVCVCVCVRRLVCTAPFP